MRVSDGNATIYLMPAEYAQATEVELREMLAAAAPVRPPRR